MLMALGQDQICVEVDETTGACTRYLAATVEPVPSAISEQLTPIPIPELQIPIMGTDYSVYLQQQLDQANAKLKAADAANKASPNISTASALAAAQSAYAQAQQQIFTQAVAKANPVSGCSMTIIGGVCDTYVYIGGIGAAVLLLAMVMGR